MPRHIVGRQRRSGQDKLPAYTRTINVTADKVPQLRRKLPLVEQARALTCQQSVRGDVEHLMRFGRVKEDV
ncbi:MAG TPA: hypothetical protein VKZ73_11065 [Microbacterium sp.]|nr:hypothetical protein [Microbacterium sp.]